MYTPTALFIPLHIFSIPRCNYFYLGGNISMLGGNLIFLPRWKYFYAGWEFNISTSVEIFLCWVGI